MSAEFYMTVIVVAMIAALAAVAWAQRRPDVRTVVMRRAPGRPEAELIECFLSARGNPLWEATLEVLDEAILEAGNEVIDPQAEARTVDRAAAAQRALVDLKQALLDCVALAEKGELERRVLAAAQKVQENG